MGCSVTQRIKSISQPNGSLLKPSLFTVTQFDDGKILYDSENVRPANVGMAVDYLTRYMLGENIEDAFSFAYVGASIAADEYGRGDILLLWDKLSECVRGLDDDSIISACNLTTLEIWGHNAEVASGLDGHTYFVPNSVTVVNIRTMVQRALTFFEKYGPVVMCGFEFGDGYSDVVTCGEGDYLTADTLWDFKVSKYNLRSDQTLQVLMYLLMGKRSSYKEFDTVNRVGIFNPRQNRAYTLNGDRIPKEVIEYVWKYVLCY